jgi:RNA polymerase sigma-70 factor (ECF subfamily)
MREVAQQPSAAPAEDGTTLAARAKQLLAAGDGEAAREAYGELVVRLQRRASRLAFYYLRDAADADEAVQDAFVKAYVGLPGFREELPFDSWFNRILVNGCLDRLKGRGRRRQWVTSLPDSFDTAREPAASGPSPEDALIRRERAAKLAGAIDRLTDRQRQVLMLSHYGGHSSREIGELTGMNESTVRVHQFRAVRRLRQVLSEMGGGGS